MAPTAQSNTRMKKPAQTTSKVGKSQENLSKPRTINKSNNENDRVDNKVPKKIRIAYRSDEDDTSLDRSPSQESTTISTKPIFNL